MKYYERTKGVFKALPREYCKNTPERVLVIHGHLFTLDFVSRDWEGRISSLYWLSEDGQYLIRCSNHWSKGMIRTGYYRRFGTNCGKIRQCYWVLDNRRGIRPMRGFSAGIIKMSDLSEN